MGTETASSKWEGKHVAQVNGVTTEKVWSVFSDFCNIQEWFPALDTCYRVQGTDGEPGLIRYVAATKTKEETSWAKERLVKIDPIERCLSYEVIENNMGFRSYVATVKVMPVDGQDQVSQIEWSFVADPVDGWKKEDLDSYIDFILQHIAKKMELNL
ncbi:Lachrymatory-factor synthase [Cardamine amara subsp. amara]|uniref:Lachrymatory-factor synthase n=1 Tax=Cardamine amara subsp. amara TaxID=228776 RepID=A0ABD1AU85_CARAN